MARAGSEGPTIAVLCEYDALPGVGHACGHNVIAAAGLGAGLAAAALAAASVPQSVSSGSNDEVARTVILRALRASGRNDLSWKLLCAGLTDRCFFNLTVLPRRDWENIDCDILCSSVPTVTVPFMMVWWG